MYNIFKGAKFGDKFLTSDGKCLIFNCIKTYNGFERAYLIREGFVDEQFRFNLAGQSNVYTYTVVCRL